MKLDQSLIPYTKINPKLNSRPETIKLLEENTDSKLHDDSFLDLKLKVKTTKAKINK